MESSKSIKRLFESYYENHDFSGAGLVCRDNKIIFSGAYGFAHRGMRIENRLNTRFDTASITKMFTAVSILQLIDKGQLSFEDKVLEILDIKDTSISRDVTIYQLLTHTSGIGDDADEEDGESYEELWVNKPNYSVRELVDFLPQFIHKPAKFLPGEGCRYNNVAYILLGLVIEKLSDCGYRDYVTENIFKKAGMLNSEFCSMDGIFSNTAEGYTRVFNKEGQPVGWRKNIYSYPPIGTSDGGAFTTVGDLMIFIRALKNNVLLSDSMIDELFRPKVLYRKYDNYDYMMGYGFQFLVDKNGKVTYMKKDGVNPGVACILSYHPDTDMTIAILANQDCNVWNLHREINQLI